MVRTRGGSRLRPRVRFSTQEQEEQAPVTVPEEPQGFRRYHTKMGPRAPSLVPQRRSKRAQPSKRARTSGPGESSSSRPEPSTVPISNRGELIAPSIAGLEDQAATFYWDPDTGERGFARQGFSWRVILRQASTDR